PLLCPAEGCVNAPGFSGPGAALLGAGEQDLLDRAGERERILVIVVNVDRRNRVAAAGQPLDSTLPGPYTVTRILIWSLVTTAMRTTLAPAQIRDAILDAAERLLARYGFKKTTIDDLAREAGIGKGTVYLHFPSKEEVALCTIDRIVERLLRR